MNIEADWISYVVVSPVSAEEGDDRYPPASCEATTSYWATASCEATAQHEQALVALPASWPAAEAQHDEPLVSPPAYEQDW